MDWSTISLLGHMLTHLAQSLLNFCDTTTSRRFSDCMFCKYLGARCNLVADGKLKRFKVRYNKLVNG